MIQIAIVEDEEIYVKQLTEYIRKYQTERGRSIKVTVFGDGEDIDDQIKKFKYKQISIFHLGRNLSFAKFHSYRCLCTARE